MSARAVARNAAADATAAHIARGVRNKDRKVDD
jgi:hypothetical protein